MSEPIPQIRTSVGIAELGTQVIVHGKDLHHECVDFGFMQYLYFCVTGAELAPRKLRVLEQLWIGTGYPDARIWCNRIAGYLGSARVDPALAMSAALAASNSVAYGFKALERAYRAQLEIPETVPERETWLAAQLASGRRFAGYGRPWHAADERIMAGLQALADAGLKAGPALKRAYWLHKRLKQLRQVQLNAAGLWAAIGIDFGICHRDFCQFNLLMFAPGYAAVYAEQSRNAAFSFLPGVQSVG